MAVRLASEGAAAAHLCSAGLVRLRGPGCLVAESTQRCVLFLEGNHRLRLRCGCCAGPCRILVACLLGAVACSAHEGQFCLEQLVLMILFQRLQTPQGVPVQARSDIAHVLCRASQVRHCTRPTPCANASALVPAANTTVQGRRWCGATVHTRKCPRPRKVWRCNRNPAATSPAK